MPKPRFPNENKKIDEIIRVNHAGEYGAKRIYEGQIKYTKDEENCTSLDHMLSQEEAHLSYFTNMMIQKRVRPTILMPLWRIGGYMLGGISAIIGYKSAMLVTDEVENVIAKHYQKQIDALHSYEEIEESELLSKIKQFRLEELEHQEIAKNNDSNSAIASIFMGFLVNKICKTAIFLSKKI
ncbi:MAG: demethoxyubiquinone hydroxylase family protein [Rickettsiaceae bacterium]